MPKTISLKMPGSKSYTNRALLVAALAKGKSKIKNILLSDDTEYMLKALLTLGVKFKIRENTVLMEGTGGVLKKAASPLFVGNAGTTMRFLAAALATQEFESVIEGSKRMRERPIKDLLSSLQQLGAFALSTKGNGCPPIRIQGPLIGGTTKLSGKISSQFLSGLLMAAPYAMLPVEIEIIGKLVSQPYVEMTLSVMKDFGVEVEHKGLKKFFIKPKAYHSRSYEIEGDASSATYFWGLAALSGKDVGVTNISLRSLQADILFVKFLSKMGCLVKEKNGVWIKGPKILQPLGQKFLTELPDASLTLATLCAFADGVSRLRGLSNLRVKESDRISALATELRKLGVKIKELEDGWEIHGNPRLLLNRNIEATIETHDDHRIAMCFGMLKPFFPKLRIKNPNCVSKSYPNFWKDLERMEKDLAEAENIILTGMRGCGKTTLGKLLAKKLKRKFFDIDEMIVKRAKTTIHEIVAKKGWPYFRKLEHEAVKKLADAQNSVIAAGGGTFLDTRNTKILKKNGIVVFLRVQIPLLQKRLKKDRKTPRPSLTGENALVELTKIWKDRKKLYAAAGDIAIQLSSHDPRKNAKIIIDHIYI